MAANEQRQPLHVLLRPQVLALQVKRLTSRQLVVSAAEQLARPASLRGRRAPRLAGLKPDAVVKKARLAAVPRVHVHEIR